MKQVLSIEKKLCYTFIKSSIWMEKGINKHSIKGSIMTQNDDDRMDRFNADPNDVNDNEQYSLFKENKKVKFGSNSPKISEKIPLSKLGIVFLILLFLLILFYSGKKMARFDNRINALENRVKSVEEKDQKLDAMGYGMAKIGEQSQSVEQLKARLDHSEKTLTSRMDEISKDFEKLKQQTLEAGIRKAKPSKTAKISKNTAKHRYHIVKPGETLYTIARRYGVTVKELKKINTLSGGGVIHPGQKLMINP
jgi:LysM repeat protein